MGKLNRRIDDRAAGSKGGGERDGKTSGKKGGKYAGGTALVSMQETKKGKVDLRVKKLSYSNVSMALVKKRGLVTHAAKLLGTSWTTLKKYIDANPKLIELCQSMLEKRIDDAEMVLDNAIAEGDKTMTIFFLKTVGKKRGYIEHEKLDMTQMHKPVTFIYQSASQLSPEELQRIVGGGQKALPEPIDIGPGGG